MASAVLRPAERLSLLAERSPGCTGVQWGLVVATGITMANNEPDYGWFARYDQAATTLLVALTIIALALIGWAIWMLS
jgi:hypothetical protein